MDGDDIARFRENLKRLGIPFHVDTEAIPTAPDWNEAAHPVIRVSRAQIAELVRRGRRFLVFS